jgi:hypothetical protein
MPKVSGWMECSVVGFLVHWNDKCIKKLFNFAHQREKIMGIQYRKGICTCHGEERYIVKRIGDRRYCVQGNKKRLNDRKEPKKSSGQLDLFYEIWAERERVCFVSGQKLTESPTKDKGRWVSCFSHLLPKGTFPKFMLRKDNIVLLSPKMHEDWHTKGKSELLDGPHGEKWKELFELKAKLSLEYHTS